MRAIASLLLLSLLCASQPAFAQKGPASDHPILGIWRLEVPDTGCSETYRFRGDGTTLVTSAAEISESVYTIPNEPDAEGFYRLTDRVTKDNGKPDCSGNVMKPGANATHFVRFHPSGKLFLLCAEASIDACIGPFTRVRGEEI
ncbi:hypothetical protein [Massilia sp. HP4]|uniref:hypothetical protein n=1 Tax=Massilia sp. HP4 TaxID=2562316 RepID=UPI0010BFFF26|nr:hypothetical protein [Massilia sp. HP4]